MPYRRWIRLLGIIGTTVLTLVVTLLALLQLPPVATWVMRRIITVVPFNPGYQLQVGRVSGDWLHRLALENVRLIWKSRELARLDRLELGYDLRQLRGPVTRLRELTVNGARAEAHREGKTWDLASALKSSADTTKHGGGIRIENLKLRDVQLMAELSPDSVVRVRGLNLAGRDLVVGDTVLLASRPAQPSASRRRGAAAGSRWPLEARSPPPNSASIRSGSRPRRPASPAARCCREISRIRAWRTGSMSGSRQRRSPWPIWPPWSPR